jgi:hypothetical protein
MCKRWAKLPTGVGAKMAIIFLERVQDYLGLPLICVIFGFQGEYGKVWKSDVHDARKFAM